MLLRRQQLPRQGEYGDNLLSQLLGRLESLAVEQHFRYEFIIGDRHGHRSEQLLQVVG